MTEAKITTGRVSRNGSHRARGYIDWAPTAAKVKQRLDQVEEVLAEYEDQLPLTIRQIFYRLVGAHGYPKDEKAYKRLCETLINARRARLIPFDAIRDDGVTGKIDIHYDGLEDFHDETAKRIRRYRLNRQAGQPQYMELWCEAGGMVHQLERVALQHSVPVWSGSGFDSLTAKYDVASRALAREVPTVILHVGDFDPSGESVFTALAEDAAAFVEADRVIATLRIEPVRVALTADQVKKYELETAPPKKSDSRSKRWRGETCQLEALPPDLLADIVDEAINDHLDLDRYHEQLDREAGDRATLLALPAGDGGS